MRPGRPQPDTSSSSGEQAGTRVEGRRHRPEDSRCRRPQDAATSNDRKLAWEPIGEDASPCLLTFGAGSAGVLGRVSPNALVLRVNHLRYFVNELREFVI